MTSHPHPHSSAHDDHLASHHHRDHELHGLRLALGSILSPKRFPASRSSSGTASPMGPMNYHHHGHLGHSYHHDSGKEGAAHYSPSHSPNGTPVLLHGHSALACPPPTRSSMSRANSSDSIMHSDHEDPHHSHSHHHHHHEVDSSPSDHDLPAIVTTTNVRATPGKPPHPNRPAPGYIATLQSKSAWDALIHGSFS